MSQGDLGALIAAETSGTDLAGRLRTWRDAVHSMHSGAVRPTYAQAGTMWLNTSGALWVVTLWTGTVDVPIATIDPSAGSAAAGASFGWRNVIINPDGRVNQRLYISGAATTAANQYTVDRWRVIVSGQALSWVDASGVRTLTAPAGGVETIIPGSDIAGGQYVANWTGTATLTVNGTARTKGEVFTLPAGANATFRLSGGTYSGFQVERGTVATVAERRPLSAETAMCQAFYWRFRASRSFVSTAARSGWQVEINFPTTMSRIPTLNILATGTLSNIWSAGFTDTSAASTAFAVVNDTTGAASIIGRIMEADGEL